MVQTEYCVVDDNTGETIASFPTNRLRLCWMIRMCEGGYIRGTNIPIGVREYTEDVKRYVECRIVKLLAVFDTDEQRKAWLEIMCDQKDGEYTLKQGRYLR